jgi:hypothetical protein
VETEDEVERERILQAAANAATAGEAVLARMKVGVWLRRHPADDGMEAAARVLDELLRTLRPPEEPEQPE